MKKQLTKDEKAHMANVQAIGCIICSRPAELHHPMFCAGMGQKSPNYLVIPLCPDHHRNGGHGVAIHAGKKTFENLYGSEVALLNETIKSLVS